MENTLEIMNRVIKLIDAHKNGQLGGEFMPEDANPGLEKGSMLNYHYFTLPMALNYQRNSYKLWESSLNTFNDPSTNNVFVPEEVTLMSDKELQHKLTKYKIALQQNKQPQIWRRICETIISDFQGDIRNLFIANEFDIEKILRVIQFEKKKGFPYLSGNKIGNYWLYVMGQYTDAELTNKEALNIAPDTHVIQATIKLGLLSTDEVQDSQLQQETERRWKKLLEGSSISPIDVHTPLWLWSRNGFIEL